MSGIYWLVIGAAAGMFHGVMLWGIVAALQPAQQRRALWLVRGTAVVRCLSAATVLALAARSGWQPCLLASVGFLLTRLVLTGIVGLRPTQG